MSNLSGHIATFAWQKYQKQFKATLFHVNGKIVNQVFGNFTKVHKAIRSWERNGATRRPIELEMQLQLNLQ